MLRCILLCSFLLLLVQLAHQQATTANESPLIETTLGRIRGSVMTSRKGRDFYAYRGIYYAKAPTGQRRFAPPEPVEPWSDTLDALADGYTCPQAPNLALTGDVEIDEDCLSLNVFTANVTASNPVIVYIHGGENKGSNAHSEYKVRPHYMLDHDVVLVSVYFRLGAFGFLSTGTPNVFGNIGYLDQILALKWVQQHIANFGGDPNRVTLMGFSAGSFAATAHLASPLSAGLFHALVAQSGSVTGPFDVNNVYWTRKLAHELGCPKFGAQYMLNCLRKVSWQEIVEVCERWENYKISNMKWNYEIDGNFLLEHPSEAIRNNRFNRVPIITGTTLNEFDSIVQILANDDDLLNDIDLNFGLYADDLLNFKSTGNDDERAIAMRQFYFNTAAIDKNSLVDMGHMKSDCMISLDVHELVQLAKNYTNVYYYRFDYAAENSFGPGVGHGADTRYFLPRQTSLVDINSTDNFMVDRMTKLFSSFAANGAPPVLDNVTWPPFTAKDPVVMYIDRDLYTGGPYSVERYALWDRVFPLKESSAEIQFPLTESSAAIPLPLTESNVEIQAPPKESSAEIQFPAIVVLLFAAAWHLLL